MAKFTLAICIEERTSETDEGCPEDRTTLGWKGSEILNERRKRERERWSAGEEDNKTRAEREREKEKEGKGDEQSRSNPPRPPKRSEGGRWGGGAVKPGWP